VSAHVARAFPSLLESKIVLAHQSFTLSREQLSKINPGSTAIKTDNQLLPFRPSPSSGILLGSTLNGGSRPQTVSYAIGLWLTTGFLTFGSQSVTVQETIISLLNPGIITLIIYIGPTFSKHSLWGVVWGTFVVSIFVAACQGLSRSS
jgi:hypothetical protein